MKRKFFLGFDCSTQSLSSILIDYDSRKILHETQINFERDLPHYGTKSGILRQADPLLMHSPPLMWVEALDLLFAKMRSEGVSLREVQAISGSAQQHGSLYLNDRFLQTPFSPALPLKEQCNGIFSRPTSPIWMDASTTVECEEIRKALGGKEKVITLTGSDLFERFTGPQIRKFYKTEPDLYAQTTHIALVSSFMASLLSGTIAPIDYGDGSGMSLMEIKTKKWSPEALKATAPHLEKKLPPLCPSNQIIGTIHSYFVAKYGLSPGTPILAWTGDNPSSLVGLGLIKEGIAAISLGTSFTHFSYLRSFCTDPRGEGLLFVSPTGDYMPMNCFQNGALAIQWMREHYHFNWDAFNRALAITPWGAHGAIMLPYVQQEIVPKVLTPGIRRYHLREQDAAENCRALVEGQLLSMRLHAEWMHLKSEVIYATGGVSSNQQILQIAADIHQCVIERSTVGKSSALGAALRAAYAIIQPKSWEEIVKGFTDPAPFRIEPNPKAAPVYQKMLKEYAKCEQEFLAEQAGTGD